MGRAHHRRAGRGMRQHQGIAVVRRHRSRALAGAAVAAVALALAGQVVPAGGQSGGQFGAERLEQALGLAVGVQVGGVQRERVEEDLRLRPARGLRQLDERPPGDRGERLGVRRPRHPGHIDQGQVDVPQNQPVNDVLPDEGYSDSD